jgi:ankyrin repeat protein
MFADGNGRTVFIFANLLLSMNNLPPFYPNNMCIFDANSMPRMVREVIEGQKRFRAMFGTKEEFNHNLEAYKKAVENLSALILTKFTKIKSIVTALNERNFNLLLRQSAISEDRIELLKFLLENHSFLNIDPSSAGQTSGTALDIAKKHGNEEACRLLKEAL